jgi:protein-tyrosine-phosphatase
MADKLSVLFVCVHNAGRSQMAAGRVTSTRPGWLAAPVALVREQSGRHSRA